MIKKILIKKVNSFITESNIKINDESDKFEYFCNNMILKKCDFNEEDLDKGNIDGGGDEGIDSIFITVNEKVVSDKDFLDNLIDRNSIVKFIFIQSKKSSGFSESALLKFKSGLECIFEENYEELNNDFKRQAEIITKAWEKKVDIGNMNDILVECYYCSLEKSDNSAKSNSRITQKKKKDNKLFER